MSSVRIYRNKLIALDYQTLSRRLATNVLESLESRRMQETSENTERLKLSVRTRNITSKWLAHVVFE